MRSAQAALAVSAGATDREALIGEIVRATRIFARRQRTWLRDEPVLLIEPAVLTSAEAFERLVQELRLELDQVQPAQAQLTQAQSSASESSSGDGGQDARR